MNQQEKDVFACIMLQRDCDTDCSFYNGCNGSSYRKKAGEIYNKLKYCIDSLNEFAKENKGEE